MDAVGVVTHPIARRDRVDGPAFAVACDGVLVLARQRGGAIKGNLVVVWPGVGCSANKAGVVLDVA